MGTAPGESPGSGCCVGPGGHLWMGRSREPRLLADRWGRGAATVAGFFTERAALGKD